MSTTEREPGASLSEVSVFETISTSDLKRRLDDPSLALVDVRPMAAYNGWPLQGEARGGHIRGAVPFPLAWLALFGPEEVGPYLAERGITPEKSVVAYGDSPGAGAAFLAKLAEAGYERLLAYAGGAAEWAADPELPMERLPRYEKLVYPAWVQQLIAGGQPHAYDGRGFALFHVNFGVPEEYADGHIPGAAYLDTNALESPATWNRRSPEELEAALLAHGITRDTLVVLYGRDTVGQANEKWPGRRAGQIAAMRAGAILTYAGVEDVRLLDGGYDAWVAAGGAVETQARQPEPAAAFGAPIPAGPGWMVDIDEAKAILADPNGRLVSIRTWTEHIGDVSGYNYIERRGRIAGSVWGNCGSDAYHMQHYRNVDNTMRSYKEIEANWQLADITHDRRVAFYCGTGWRASETLFYAYLMGWDRIAVYDGGWFEWIQDPANPVEVGTP
jgi:molybdopterin synthase sulfurtransferase